MFTTKRRAFNFRCGSCNGLHRLDNERGSAIIVALVILAVLSLFVQILTQSSTTEIQIAGSDRVHKETFYAADGATELAAELLEQNVACPTGFTGATKVRGGLIEVETLAFWQNTEDSVQTPGDGGAGEQPRDFFLPTGYNVGAPHTNFTIGGRTRFAVGSAIEMAAGYEGKGKAAAAAGTHIIYDIATQRVGLAKSQSIVWTQYRHVTGSEGTCIP
jgi:hypothetical protein